jgi:CYTH domain-containing protein
MELDIYNDIDLVVCEYESDNEIMVDSLPLEDWFLKEITTDVNYKNSNLSYSLKQKVQ